MKENSVFVDVISDELGMVTGSDGTQIEVDATFLTKHPVLYDSLYVVGGTAADQSKFEADMKEFITMTYKHYKPIGVAAGAEKHIREDNLEGVVFAENNDNFAQDFVTAISKHRFWNRT